VRSYRSSAPRIPLGLELLRGTGALSCCVTILATASRITTGAVV